MDPLKWAFELIDKVSGPAERMERSVGRFEKQMRRLMGMPQPKDSLGELIDSDKLGKIAPLLSAAGVGFGLLSAAVIGAGAAFGAFSIALGTAAVDFGSWVVKAAAFRESTLTTFQIILGTKEKAHEIFNEATQLAAMTPWESSDVITAYKQLAGAGFKSDELKTVFMGLSDVAALADFDKSVMALITRQFGQVKGKGRLQMEELRTIVEHTGRAGVGYALIYEKLAKQLKVSVPEVEKLISSGKVSADTGLFAILDAIRERGGGALGNVTMQQSKTLTGLLSTIGDTFGQLMNMMHFEEMPGMVAFKGFLQNIVTLFDPSGVAGSTISAFIEDVTNDLFSIFEPFSGKNGLRLMEEGFRGVVTMANTLYEALRPIGAFFEGAFMGIVPMLQILGLMGSAAGPKDLTTNMRELGLVVGDTIGKAIVGITMLINQITLIADVVANLFSALYGSGGSAAMGKATGSIGSAILDGLASVNPALGVIGGLGAEMYMGGFTGPKGTDSHSPSKKFEQFGEWSMEGFQKGMGGPEMGAIDFSAKGSGGSPGMGPATVHLTVNIDNKGHQDGSQIAKTIERTVGDAMAGLFERLAMESGVA